ncbi:hypothetical protein K491DRAFT_592587 [Lophiostoma macrostomum CBS 122681]|uniref:Conidiation-specific expression protein n=1 Tax=Lophiostoma macrostomum CBS 122681 TaxID=1314788 RepID=A0A6A6TH10_9PLEO|nr:hypothetical protein K491DRAFT_592587 [Lophiostoma macrostomum CBS 122681]
MPSNPFQQKYSSQSHKFFGEHTMPAMPEGAKDNAERRGSDSSVGSAPSPSNDRRRSSVSNRYAALQALKRPTDQASTERRSSLQDSYGKPGFLGSMWNNFTRGPSSQSPPVPQTKEPRDTTTLRS